MKMENMKQAARPESAKRMNYQELREEFEPAMQAGEKPGRAHAARSMARQPEKDRILENKQHTLRPLGPMSM